MPYKDLELNKQCRQRYAKSPSGKAADERKQERYRAKPENKYRIYLYRATQLLKVGFSLSLKRFKILIAMPCRYCGETPAKGIDRLSNRRGYTYKNSAPCCGVCNRMKLTWTEHEFLMQVKRIFLRRFPGLLTR